MVRNSERLQPVPDYDTDDAWSQYFASYAGLDGGNPNASVWICGIEHGGSIAPMADAPPPVHELGAWDACFREQHPAFRSWQ